MEFITCALNEIFRLGKVPEMFKLGYITPIYKKHGKPIHDPNSYMRITITSLIGKILKNSFFPRTIPMWKSLPSSVVSSKTIEEFKAQI